MASILRTSDAIRRDDYRGRNEEEEGRGVEEKRRKERFLGLGEKELMGPKVKKFPRAMDGNERMGKCYEPNSHNDTPKRATSHHKRLRATGNCGYPAGIVAHRPTSLHFSAFFLDLVSATSLVCRRTSA